MAWFAICDKVTGALVSETSRREAIADPLPNHLEIIEFEGNRPDFLAMEWNRETKSPMKRG